MLLKRDAQLLVFKIDDLGTFESIGQINHFTSLIWPNKFNGFSQFQLWAPITKENSELLKQGNILWSGGDNAVMIEIVKAVADENGDKIYDVKGRTLEMILTTRIIWGTYNATSLTDISTIMYNLVDINCINPTDINRKIPFLELAPDLHFGGKITYQKTGGEVYDALVSVASDAGLGFAILFRPKEKKLIFEVQQGIDRTIYQSIVDPVEFSSDLEDILSSSYYTNNQDIKSVALVAGEGESVNRVKQISGDNTTKGFLRRELYVDARDLQSSSIDENGVEVVLTPEQYKQTLVQRGNEKLSVCKVTETFEAQLRVLGNVQYTLGIDYKKGDTVTVIDKQLNVSVSAVITEVEEHFGEEYALVVTFGYSYPTIIQKVKQQIL